jgi:hypothetical protein
MPVYSSHFLQPLDVGCFSPLKRAYGRLIKAKARLGFYSIDKLNFLRTYPQAREEVFSYRIFRVVSMPLEYFYLILKRSLIALITP